MKKKLSKVYQFKITLHETNPPVWRRIQVPEAYTFWDLHVAIQDAMGWLDCHLHVFEVRDPVTGGSEEIGIPDDEFVPDKSISPGWDRKISHYFTMENRVSRYVYDFGDNWRHEILFEKILNRDESARYPVCTGGERACPPEDCGGSSGYFEFLEIIMDPAHEQYEEMLNWVGGDFEPEYFDAKGILFDDPAKRLRML